MQLPSFPVTSRKPPPELPPPCFAEEAFGKWVEVDWQMRAELGGQR
jgi:hypothetical protein